jgi:hypothetical protein
VAAAYIHRFYLLFRRIDTENPSESGGSFRPADELPSACGLLVDDSSKAVSVVLGLRSNPATLLASVCPVNRNNRFVIGLGRFAG